ncbi:hypothetical protein AMAG_15487 [Allomyces macrogynus ATCC 38327]|uniref:Uncharacterized protein n=1 Tax=Allomyces macrogynus (strain ATCC 38327) TaxID=578462 RepID=A0A0L0T7R2_ALLM3|nr:hypothetical protein AMAG_15487 [Allomyces macrogynus ATCC 38327]|eukprot:KNE70736.1 hypothetical protein AMAG_15487 [Allomyces macrogynus ATCC 38327]
MSCKGPKQTPSVGRSLCPAHFSTFLRAGGRPVVEFVRQLTSPPTWRRAALPPVPRIPSTVKRLVLHDFSPNRESIFAELLVGDSKLPRNLRPLSVIDSDRDDRWIAIGYALAEQLPEFTSLQYFTIGNGPPCSAARALAALPNGGRLRELKVETTIDAVTEVMTLRQLAEAMPDEIESVVELLSRTPFTCENLCIVLEDYYISDHANELVTVLFPNLPPTLEALLLINNDLTMAHFAGLSSWAPNLRHLDLSGNWLDTVPVPVPRKMQYLGIAGNVAVRMFNNPAVDHAAWVRALPSSLCTIELYYGKAAVMQALLEHFPDRPDHWRLRFISRKLRGGTWAESAGELGVPLDAMRAKFDLVDGEDLAEEGLLGIVGRPRRPDVTKIDEGE